jgi:hypothetical protein
LRGPGLGEEVKPYDSEKHNFTKHPLEKPAPNMRVARNRKILDKNKTQFK